MKTKAVSLLVMGLIMISAGCGKQVSRIDIDKKVDLSGKWNDTDSRLVSEEMISDCLGAGWLGNFSQKKSKGPVVIVGSVSNKTDEHIISQTFTKDLEKAFINSGKVDVVASKEERQELREEKTEHMEGFVSADTAKQMGNETGADYMMKGVINSIRDKEGNKSVIFYQINLELIDIETNRKAWIGEKKIKKYIKE